MKTKICLPIDNLLEFLGWAVICEYIYFSEPPAKKLEKNGKFAKNTLKKNSLFSSIEKLFAKLQAQV